ncbi:hypothetical protein ACJ41O_014992 [Fusarium nematophilum]
MSTPLPLHQAPRFGPSMVVPTLGHGAVSLSCSTIIAAEPVKCLEAVLNMAAYPSWNTFCPSVRIQHAPPPASSMLGTIPEIKEMVQKPGYAYTGVKFEFQVIMQQGKAPTSTKLQVSVLEKFQRNGRSGYRVAWTLRDSPYYFLRAERVQEFLETDDGSGTEYYCWETFGGVMGYGIRHLVGSQLEDGFGRWTDSLKEWVESAGDSDLKKDAAPPV